MQEVWKGSLLVNYWVHLGNHNVLFQSWEIIIEMFPRMNLCPKNIIMDFINGFIYMD